jgi:hypothetical protein
MSKDPKLPRNPLDSWWIPGGFLEELTVVKKMLETQYYPGIPEGIDSFSKNVRPKTTQEFLAFLVDSWRN